MNFNPKDSDKEDREYYLRQKEDLRRKKRIAKITNKNEKRKGRRKWRANKISQIKVYGSK
jgi:hypothetical protein